ncbi:MAG: type VI secretion system baseplate subunit TssK [Pseudomonadota bacterium]
MQVQRPPVWHQGLFLQPQHFQMADLSFQARLTPFFNFLAPHFWGVNGVEIRKAALAQRNLDPVRGEFLFPDGTYAVFPGNAVMEGRSFEEGWIEGGKPLDIYVGLKKWNDAGANVTTLSKLENLTQVSTRYVAPVEVDDVRDLHCGGPDGQVKTMYAVLKLFWGSEREQLGDYLLLPFARVERVGGDVRLSEQFVPPCLTISGCESP